MRDRIHQRHLRLVTRSSASPSEPRTWAEGPDRYDPLIVDATEPYGLRLTPTCAGFMLAVD